MTDGAPLTRDEIRARVDRIMVEEFEVEEEALRPEALLRELGLDSLDGVDLVVALEKDFGTRIPEEEARAIQRLGDIYERIEQGATSLDAGES